jgi:hypothetical protein
MQFSPANDRGFFLGKFKDRYGSECSLQESSICASEGHVWFGMDNPDLKYFIPHQGWNNVSEEEFKSFLPKDAQPLLSSRMHLSQSDIENLLPSLMYFTKRGYLPNEEHDETKQEMDGYRESIHLLRKGV